MSSVQVGKTIPTSGPGITPPPQSLFSSESTNHPGDHGRSKTVPSPIPLAPLSHPGQSSQINSLMTCNPSTYSPPSQDNTRQYQGYAELCQFAASSSDAFILRRFNELNARVIYSMQDDIVQLERDLKILDRRCMESGLLTKYGDSFQQVLDPSPTRTTIIKTLRGLLKEYNDYILAYGQLRQRSTAQKFQINNVSNWFSNHNQDIVINEQEFIKTEDDLIPIVAEPKSWLRLGIEKISPVILRGLFPARYRVSRFHDPNTFYVSNKRMEGTLTAVIVLIGLVALLVPLWWLNKVSDSSPNTNYRLGIISGCTVFFTIVLVSATVRRPFEVLVGTAGYAAVLMVFMQLQGGGSPMTVNALQQ